MAFPRYTDWNRLRLDNIFGQSQNQGIGPTVSNPYYEDPDEIQSQFPVQPQQPGMTPNIDVDATERYKQYQPQMEMQNRFAKAAQNPPNRMDFQPSVMERISAGLQSFGGPATYWGGIPVGYKANPNADEIRSNILNRPYNEAALDYKMQIDPLRAAADDERMANTVQSNFLDRTVNRDIQERNLERMFEKDQTAGRQKDATIAQAQQRLKIYEKAEDARAWRTRNPTRETKQNEDGFLISINKDNPADTVPITDRNGEPIRGSDLPDRERIELTIQGGIIRDAAQGAQARETKATPPAAAPGRTTKRHEVVYDADGNPVGIRETTTESGPTQGGSPPQNAPRAQGQGNKVVMYAPNGQMAWIKIEDTDQAQIDGFTFNDPRTGSDFRPPQRRPLGR